MKSTSVSWMKVDGRGPIVPAWTLAKIFFSLELLAEGKGPKRLLYLGRLYSTKFSSQAPTNLKRYLFGNEKKAIWGGCRFLMDFWILSFCKAMETYSDLQNIVDNLDLWIMAYAH